MSSDAIVKGFEDIGDKVSDSINYLTEQVPEEITTALEVEVSLDDEQIRISDESLMQYQAVIGEPVKWKKQFVVDSITGFSVELPKGSENINVKIIEDGEEKDMTEIVDINKKRRF